MASSPAIELSNDSPTGLPVMTVASLTKWTTVIGPGGILLKDADVVQNPNNDCVNATTFPFRIVGTGTYVLVRLGYNKLLTNITSPTVKLLGRTGQDAWDFLYNAAGNTSIQLTCSPATDVYKANLSYTSVNPAVHKFDCKGNNECIVAVEIPLVATGNTATAIVQIKVI